jgi:hypothetical protein
MAQKQSNTPENGSVQFVFGKLNYQLLIASILVVIVGFILMSGETDIYSFRKIVLAPIVVLSGFALGFYAVLKKPSSK